MVGFGLNRLRGNPRELEVQDTSAGALVSAEWLLLIVALLVMFGLTMLYSASYGVANAKYFRNQLLWVGLGVVSGGAAFVFGYRKVSEFCWPLIIGCFLALLAARFFFPKINGAYRWIRFGGFSLQPSEFAKLAVALFTAKYCSDNLRTFGQLWNRRGLLPLGAICGALIGGVLLGKDLGTTLLISLTCFLTLIVAGLAMWYWIVPIIGGTLIGIYIYLFDAERLSRVTSFLHPESVQETEGYQLWTSLMALGSGDWCGVGFMASRMKAKYLPEAHTDFILAVVGEELGWIGMVCVIIAYTLFTVFAIRIALKAASRQGMLLGFALTMGLAFQAIINLSVVSGSIPTKGMPAPFLSYGGSNMMASLTAVGLLLSIAAEAVDPEYSERILNRIKAHLPWKKRENEA